MAFGADAGEGAVGDLDRLVEVAQVDDRELAVVAGRVGVLARRRDALHGVRAGRDGAGQRARAGGARAHGRVRRVGDVDDDHLTAADAAALRALARVDGDVVEVVADEHEALQLAAHTALAVRHGLVLEDEVGQRARELRVQRIAGVEDADGVEARDVEEVAGLRELAGDPLRLGEGGGEADVRAHRERHVDPGRARRAVRHVIARVVGERGGARRQRGDQGRSDRDQYSGHEVISSNENVIARCNAGVDVYWRLLTAAYPVTRTGIRQPAAAGAADEVDDQHREPPARPRSRPRPARP